MIKFYNCHTIPSSLKQIAICPGWNQTHNFRYSSQDKLRDQQASHYLEDTNIFAYARSFILILLF